MRSVRPGATTARHLRPSIRPNSQAGYLVAGLFQQLDAMGADVTLVPCDKDFHCVEVRVVAVDSLAAFTR